MKPMNKKELVELHDQLLKAWEMSDGTLSEDLSLVILEHHQIPFAEVWVEEISELYNRMKAPSIDKLEELLYRPDPDAVLDDVNDDLYDSYKNSIL